MLPNIPQGGLQESPFPQLPTVPAVHHFHSLPVMLPRVPKPKRGLPGHSVEPNHEASKEGQAEHMTSSPATRITLPPSAPPQSRASTLGAEEALTLPGKKETPGGWVRVGGCPEPLTRGAGGTSPGACSAPRSCCCGRGVAGGAWKNLTGLEGATSFWQLSALAAKRPDHEWGCAGGLCCGWCWGLC